VIDEEQLEAVLRIPHVILLNYLEATAWSVPSLGKNTHLHIKQE
jgi:glucokinase